VRPDHGVGDTETAAPDIVIRYTGETISVARP
jgi:hypothetical protein